MSTFKPQQRRLVVRDRVFHFVSYEGQRANPKNGETSSPDMWYLMVEGHRCPVFPCEEGRSDSQLETALATWAEDHAFGPPAPTPKRRRPRIDPAKRSQTNWWGPY